MSTVTAVVPATDTRPLRFMILRTMFARRRAKVLGGLLLLFVLLAVFGPMLAPYGENEQNLIGRLQGPSTTHWLGTDNLGRDIFSLLLYGIRLTLVAAGLAISVALVLGIPAGLIAGYSRGWFGTVANALSDVLLSLPPLILALAIVGARGPGVGNAMFAVGVILSPRFFRVARGTAQAVTEKTFIEAARAIGCSTPRLLLRHVLTNSIAPVMVQVTFSLGLAIVAEASLSFLGLGAQPPSVSLGTMVRDAFANVRESSWAIYPPAIVIAFIVYLVSALGDSLQDSLVSGGR